MKALARVGVSLGSGVPVWLVECPDCGDQYRLCAYPSQVERTPRCKSCAKRKHDAERGLSTLPSTVRRRRWPHG